MLRNGWGWLIEQRKRMARAVSGYFWSSFVGIPGSGRSDVWWALDRPGVSFLTKIKYLYYCLYLYIVHCTCTVVLWFYFCSLWRLNWDWIETELKVEFCRAAFSTFYKLLPGADFEEFSRVCIFPSCQERIREIFFLARGGFLRYVGNRKICSFLQLNKFQITWKVGFPFAIIFISALSFVVFVFATIWFLFPSSFWSVEDSV